MKQTIYAMSLTVALILSGCGTNSKVDPVQPIVTEEEDNTPLVDENITIKPIVLTIDDRNIILTSNSETVPILVHAYNKSTLTPYTSGSVQVKMPSKVLSGTDVGYFSSYNVAVNENGIATFNYTGPQDLKALIDSKDKGSTFEFYHIENPTSKVKVTVSYEPQSDYKAVNYKLNTSSSDTQYTMGLDESKTFSISLLDDKGKPVDNDSVKSIKIVSENTVIGLLEPGNLSELNYSGDDATSTKTFNIKTSQVSGLLPIDVEVVFDDANGEEQRLETKMNITVFSGPPTAMSISYAGVEHDKEHAKFIEKFIVTVTDAYNNPVNTKPFIATGAMVEYAVDGSSNDGKRDTTSPRLWYGRYDNHLGTINPIGNNKAQFEVDTDVFKYIDFANDKMVVFGSGYVYEALGKWDISPNSDSVIDLVDDYNGSKREGLYYAVGHNNRQDLCSEDGREYVGNMESNTYQIDDSGSVIVKFTYDYHLTGKDIMLWVNLTGYQADNNSSTRIGEAQKHTLRGMGLMTPHSYTIPKNSGSAIYHFDIHHAKIPEWYLNGHFGYAIIGKCKVEGIEDTSNQYDARSCRNGGVAYVDLKVSNPSDSDCVITLDKIAVSPEF